LRVQGTANPVVHTAETINAATAKLNQWTDTKERPEPSRERTEGRKHDKGRQRKKSNRNGDIGVNDSDDGVL
jgi:hypothetical protein